MTIASSQVEQQWVSFYGHPPAMGGLPYTLAIGPGGDVYVTGLSRESYFTNELTTIKYNSSGQRIWADRFVQTNASSVGLAIVVDQFENVYVTGASTTYLSQGGQDYDHLTIKYNQSGERQWVALYGGTNYGIGSSLRVDQASNVYVGGSPGTIKYSPDGTRLWGPLGIPGRLEIANDGSLYVVGEGGLAKYTSEDGTELWRRTVTGLASVGIALAESNAVCVLGRVKGAGVGDDYFTAKYTAEGTQLWAARYNGQDNRQDFPNAIHVSADGSVIVTGICSDTNVGAVVTLKYSSNGDLLWRARSLGHNVSAMAVDRYNQVYLTGHFVTSTNGFFKTIKYDREGNHVWSTLFDRPVSSGFHDDRPLAVGVDTLGAIYVTGESQEAPDGGTDWATVKYLEQQIIGLPAVLTQPRSQTASPGSTVTFSVEANGEPPLTYQWRFQWNPMPGETNSNLVLTNVQFANAGDYSVEVANPLGAVRTPEASLTFPTRMTAPAFVNNGRFRFTVEGDARRYFAIQASTNFINWLTLSDVPNSTGVIHWTNTSSTLKRRYFRAIQQP